jgi:hypothetical protein
VSDVLSLHGLAGRNLLGLSLWPDTHYMHNLFGSALSNYTPADLFAAGEQGAWYDPSDMSTLFQDAAGTVPVTAVEQFVGLMLDKSKGLVLGSELVPNTYTGSVTGSWVISSNSITRNGTTSTSCSLNLLSPTAPTKMYQVTFLVAGLSGDTFTVNVGGANVGQITSNGQKSFVAAGGGSGMGFVPWNGTTGQLTITNISVRELPGNHASQPTSTARPRLSARVNLLTKTEDFADSVWANSSGFAPNRVSNDAVAPDGTLTADKVTFTAPVAGDQSEIEQSVSGLTLNVLYTATAYVKAATASDIGKTILYRSVAASDYNSVTLTADYQRISITSLPAAASITGMSIGLRPALGGSSGTVSVHIWGADLRPANQSNLPYQRVNTSTDYDTVGFPRYLAFDGVDDFMSTGNINFTGTDKMTVWAGVRKLSDGAFGGIVEHGINTDLNGSFALFVSNNAGYYMQCGAAANRTFLQQSGGAIAPRTDIVSMILDRAKTDASELQYKINAATSTSAGVAISGTTADGNYGNYPMFIGSRAGTSFRFNGHLYQLIIRGAQTNAAQLSNTENWVNTRTGAY